MIEFFNNFSEEELVSFNDFINSKYFNSNKNIINLFNYLKSFIPGYKRRGLYKEKIIRSYLFGKKKSK